MNAEMGYVVLAPPKPYAWVEWLVFSVRAIALALFLSCCSNLILYNSLYVIGRRISMGLAVIFRIHCEGRVIVIRVRLERSLHSKTFALSDGDRAMLPATPFNARQGMMLKLNQQNDGIKTDEGMYYLVHKEPHEYTNKSLEARFERNSAFGDG